MIKIPPGAHGQLGTSKKWLHGERGYGLLLEEGMNDRQDLN